MDATRRKYQKEWVAKKRSAINLQNKLVKKHVKAADFDTSDSEICDDVEFQIPANSSFQNSISTHMPTTGVTGYTCEPESGEPHCSSTSHDDSLSDDDCWEIVDRKCSWLSDSSESDDDCQQHNLKTKLQAWAFECSVTHNQLNKLLPILQELDKTTQYC
jgi:hypothetical protein